MAVVDENGQRDRREAGYFVQRVVLPRLHEPDEFGTYADPRREVTIKITKYSYGER